MYTGSIDIGRKFDFNRFYHLVKFLEHPYLLELCNGEVAFEIIKGKSTAIEMLNLFNTFCKPQPLEKLEKTETPRGVVNIIVRTSFDSEDQVFVPFFKGLLCKRSSYFKAMFSSKFSESASTTVQIDELTGNKSGKSNIL